VSWLTDMMGKAKDYLAKTPKPVDKATDSVKHDRFDGEVFRELLEEAPALADMVTDFSQHYDYTEDMVRDVLMEFWQGDPLLRQPTEMRPGWLTNHAVSNHIAGSPDTEQTRSYTMHDRYGAAMATLAVSEKVREFLENREDVQEAAEEADQAEQEQQEAEDALTDALVEAEQCTWPEIGPPSPQAQAAAEALQQALAQMQAKADAAQQAGDQAQQVAAQAKAALRTPVHDAIKEAGEELAEEAALFAAWGVEDGEVQKMSFKERAELAGRLRSAKLTKWAGLVGRFKLMMHAMRTKKVEYGRDEVVGVELSDDLSRLVGVEYVNLVSHPALRLDFLRRLTEGRMLTREYIGVEQVGQGAIICLVDTSGSMKRADQSGIPREVWAKAFALALLDQAQISKRDFVAISFSSAGQQRMWEFPKGRVNLEHLIEFTEHFWDGGTNYERPMTMALEKLEREFNQDGSMKGDIVFITDDDCGVSPDWMHAFLAHKARLGFRVFGIKVGVSRGYGAGLEAISDNVRTVAEFASPETVQDIFQMLH
jgi:uncharacterized protein with von Willebrand factor type A (vWA) domain